MRSSRSLTWTCKSCLWAQRQNAVASSTLSHLRHSNRRLSSATWLRQEKTSTTKQQDGQPRAEEEQGALSRQLADMAEEAMVSGSKSDRKVMAEAGFSEDLKRQLEERIAESAFRAQNQQALSQASMPLSAGRGTREQAAAEPWQGTESLHDAALRMLDDSHKKIRTPSRIPRPAMAMQPAPKAKRASVGDRLANARDKTSYYASSLQSDMSDEDREKLRKELKERFSPGARPMPTSLQGLTSLANERIEDAIARGQFKNIQRGKGINVERDYAANSPFLDNTEYFMNKIIQKQEIVPPWIEKQQELVKLVASFRSRLRNNWRRHAARMIASEGGSIESQVRRARGYALTEEELNPRPNKRESMTGIGSDGSLTTITVEERMALGIAPDEQNEQRPEVTIKVTETKAEDAPQQDVVNDDSTVNASTTASPSSGDIATSSAIPSSSYTPASTSPPRVLPMPYLFRDPSWVKTEQSYHELAIAELNALTRSYNLMAPKIAQKPYYTLERELNRCYADVAPTIADEILERSRKPTIKVEVIGHREGGIMKKFEGTGHVARVRDEKSERSYGFKEFWRDLFSKDEDPRQRNRSSTL